MSLLRLKKQGVFTVSLSREFRKYCQSRKRSGVPERRSEGSKTSSLSTCVTNTTVHISDTCP